MEERKIVLVINDKELSFQPTIEDQERLVNEIEKNNKVAPMHNFLVRSVCKESKDDLLPLLKYPTHTVQIAEMLASEVVPDIKVELGK